MKCFPSFFLTAPAHENRSCFILYPNRKDLSILSCFTNGWFFFLVCFLFFCEFSIYSGRKVKPAKLSTGQHLNLCIDNGLTFAQLTVSLWLASASSLFSHLWLGSLLKALTHTLVCAWSRWTPTSSQHHGPWLLTGCESLTRSPLSEYQSAAFLSM